MRLYKMISMDRKPLLCVWTGFLCFALIYILTLSPLFHQAPSAEDAIIQIILEAHYQSSNVEQANTPFKPGVFTAEIQNNATIDSSEKDSIPEGEAELPDQGPNSHPSRPKIWISMGLCWGENAQIHGKNHFPYAKAAARSTVLWHRLTHARVILQIMHSAPVSQPLREYKLELEKEGAHVVLNRTSDLPCVTSAQIIRLLAYRLAVVEAADVIITADVDAFITSASILNPLFKEGRKVWIWRYGLTRETGFTFAISFIGALSGVWRKLIGQEGSLGQLVQHYNKSLNFKDGNENSWGIDQLIVSRVILESGMCTLPSSNPLWRDVNLNPVFHTLKDGEDDCWYGEREWDDCNIGLLKKVCFWWHFYPKQNITDLDNKYREILETNRLSSF